MKPPEAELAIMPSASIRSRLCPVKPTLVNRQVHKSRLQHWRRQAVLLPTFEEVAQNSIYFDGCTVFEIAIHRGRQPRTLGRKLQSLLPKERIGLWIPAGTCNSAALAECYEERSAPPGIAAISPMLPRIRQVMLPSVASCTHFCHISRMMWSELEASKPAPWSVSSSFCRRCVL
jgi:hypothetical protein